MSGPVSLTSSQQTTTRSTSPSIPVVMPELKDVISSFVGVTPFNQITLLKNRSNQKTSKKVGFLLPGKTLYFQRDLLKRCYPSYDFEDSVSLAREKAGDIGLKLLNHAREAAHQILKSKPGHRHAMTLENHCKSFLTTNEEEKPVTDDGLFFDMDD